MARHQAPTWLPDCPAGKWQVGAWAHHRLESVWMPQLHAPFPETWLGSLLQVYDPATGVGTSMLVVLPMPSWPFLRQATSH